MSRRQRLRRHWRWERYMRKIERSPAGDREDVRCPAGYFRHRNGGTDW